ncbi:twin-arginine translocation signal domain-containing protein [Glycomyces halotolerans]
MESDRRPTLNRRRLLLGAAAAGSAAAFGAAAPASAAVPGFPTFNHLGVALNKGSLDYNPTDELIFPSIRYVAGRVQNPLGAWYMYYAPHDAPGGICLAYADSLDGPWTEYSANPIIPRTWSPHYSVSHVSSPHALWNDADGRIYLYFHGENTTTRVATSSDGRNFAYGGTVLHTDMLPSDVSEASYARVFPHPVQSGIHVMLFMGNQAGTRKIFIGWSHRLSSGWRFKPDPLISPRSGEGGQLSGAHYWSRNGGGHVVYHSGAGNVHVADVGTSFDRENHLGVLYDSMSGAPDNGRAAAPSFAEENGRLYMFYEAGQRASTNIAVARAA